MHVENRQHELGVLASQLVFFPSGVPGHNPPACPLVSVLQCNLLNTSLRKALQQSTLHGCHNKLMRSGLETKLL